MHTGRFRSKSATQNISKRNAKVSKLYIALRKAQIFMFNTSGRYVEIFGCLGLDELRPLQWASFVSSLATHRTNNTLTWQSLIHSWLLSRTLRLSSNLVQFAKQGEPTLIVSSPWETRPLGRPLPDINSTCDCRSSDRSHPHRRWNVSHTAVEGMQASAVDIRVECSACWRRWDLPTSTCTGIIHEHGGLYVVEISIRV